MHRRILLKNMSFIHDDSKLPSFFFNTAELSHFEFCNIQKRSSYITSNGKKHKVGGGSIVEKNKLTKDAL